jgi:DNA ligase (NAD+)
LVRDAGQIYGLTPQVLEALPEFQAKAAGGASRLSKIGENLLAGIEKSKQRPLTNVLFALGIRHVGYETARLLADHFRSLEALLTADAEDLQTVEGIGPIMASAIADWASRPQNQDIVRRLVADGINPVQEAPLAGAAGPLDGHMVVWRLETMSRNEAEDRIRELGGKVGSAVSKGTTALVVGAEAGSKLAKAEKLGVRTLDEEAFARLLNDGPAVFAESPPRAME